MVEPLAKFEKIKVKMSDHKPMVGGISARFFKAPEWIVAKNEIVNVQNTDEKCFLWSILAALHPAEKNVARVAKYKPYEHELDTSCLTFPVNPGNETMLAKFETSNNISLNIHGLYDGEGAYEKSSIIPFRITKEKKAKHVSFLLRE